MDTFNQPPQQPVTPPTHTSKRMTLLILLVVLAIILGLIVSLAARNDRWDDDNYANDQKTLQNNENDGDDLSSLEAELEATEFDGVSESL